VDAVSEAVVDSTDIETVFRAQYARLIARVIRDPGRAEELAVDGLTYDELAARYGGLGSLPMTLRCLPKEAVRPLSANPNYTDAVFGSIGIRLLFSASHASKLCS
jgi:hypothetical protein